MRRLTITAISLIMMGALVACGDDDDPSATPAPEDSAQDDAGTGSADPDVTDEADNAGGPGGGDATTGASGSVTADGATYGFNQVVNCDPPDAGIPNVDELLAVSALGDDGIAVHVRVQSAMDRTSHSIDFYGPDAMYNGSATEVGDGWTDAVDGTMPESPLDIGDDRITGTITVVNTRATDETVEIEVDIPYPSEITSC